MRTRNAGSETRLVTWRRLDRVGLEGARLARAETGWRLDGTVIVVHEGEPCVLRYDVECDDAWRTRAARVTGWMGVTAVDLAVDVDADARWRLNGVPRPQVEGCIDVDLGFTPSTNTLPIRRLALAVGSSAEVSAAWLRFPELELSRLDQVYRRDGERSYRYESGGGRFVAPLVVDDAGLVRQYGKYWARDP